MLIKKTIDIIVPVLNEAPNLPRLLERIHNSFKKTEYKYNIIVIDDNSNDDSINVLKSLSKKYPLQFSLKNGKGGKAYSIIEGVKLSKNDYFAMIDGDLQYPPEAIPEMFKLALENDLGVVVGNRVYQKIGRVRSFVSKAGRFIVGKLVTGLSRDTQSGLKVIKREIIEHVDLRHVYPWSIDVPMLHTAKDLGYEIGSIDIPFSLRENGTSKVNLLKATLQIVGGALKQKLYPKKVYHLHPKDGVENMLGAGIIYKRKKFLTHTTLNHTNSAIVTFTRFQKIFILSIVALFASLLFFFTKSTLIGFVAVLSTIYFADVFFNLYLVLKSLHFPPELHFEQDDLDEIDDNKLPRYTILCPMYREANVLPHFVESINKMDYPKSKLEVLLLLEEDDKETIERAQELKLESHFKVLVVPHSFPKTKPKACNYGLAHSTGEYLVIYDAEDIPDPDQLKKAVLGFKKLGDGYSCLQAKLNYHNPDQSFLTRLFTTEYSLWFDVMLPALQTVNTFIPLGGTSNHFRTSDLNKFEGWDPFNVTEDADLGVRLFRAGGKTAIIDSMTYEEASSTLKNWIRQRSRWIKGYLQTYLVHMRNPLDLVKKFKWHFIIFQLVAGLRMSFMIINPILWVMTLSYFFLYKYVGPQIESLYPASIFYMAITSAIFGNFLYVYYYMIGTAKHGQYQLIKYVFLVPIYWFFTSIAACMAFWQLFTKPHYWEKTIHGLVKKDKKKLIFKLEFAGLKEFGFSKLSIIKGFSKSSFSGGAFLIFASMFGNVMNFLYNAYLGRNLDLEDFGLLSLVGSFVFLSQVPLSALSRTVTHRSAFLMGKYNTAVKSFWNILRKKSITVSYLFTLAWILLTPYLMHLFQTDQYLPFLIFAPTWIIGFAGAVDSGFLYGNMYFGISGVVIVIESILKLLLSILIVFLGFEHLVYLAIPISMLSTFLINFRFAKRTPQKVDVEPEIANYFPVGFFTSSILNKISSIAFLSLDVILAKIYLSPTDAGLYALLSLTGKMIYFFGGQFSQFILPIVSKNEGEGNDSKSTFNKLFGATLGVSLIGFLGIGVFGYLTVPILFGSRVTPIVEFLPLFTLAMVLQVLSQSIVTYHQSKSSRSFPVINFLVSLTAIFGVVAYHSSLNALVTVMFVSSVLSFVSVGLMHIFERKLRVFTNNIIDFLGIFKKIPSVKSEEIPEKLKILIFNWRDTKHKWSGGAEVYVHEIAKRWVNKGHLVTVFCGNDGKNPRNEVVDGVQIVRRGGFYTVYLWAFLYYILRFRGKYDIVIDNENGIPFFTPLYAKEPVIGLIHHVHQEVILKELKLPKYLLPVAVLATFIERFVMPLVYKNTQMVTVSESSKNDMKRIGLGKVLPIKIVNPGVDLKLFTPAEKTKEPSILYVGRIKQYKSIDTLIKAFNIVNKKNKNVNLEIAGFGDDQKRLVKIVETLGISDNVHFLGRITDEEKIKLMAESWVFVYPSTFEGWGITSIEASACGTPVVASNVAGLRDSVKDGESGYLAKVKDEYDFAEKITKILNDIKLRKSLSKGAVSWASEFDWNRSADNFMNNILDYAFKVKDDENLDTNNLEVNLNEI
jgi:cellulose synthase/poly-beta-1,6-N-acetylglucosamine synthase-like glycosyltransferase/glycosyltransferase involved in cell wall biosynthesis/O-antigen/teichoic acid export membrane protein